MRMYIPTCNCICSKRRMMQLGCKQIHGRQVSNFKTNLLITSVFDSGGFKSQQPADRAPLIHCSQGPQQIKQVPQRKKKKRKKKEVVQACRLKGPMAHLVVGEAKNFLFKPLKSVLGLPNWKIYATEGPLPKAADRALSLKSASGICLNERTFLLPLYLRTCHDFFSSSDLNILKHTP